MKLYTVLFLAACLVTLHLQANAATEQVTVSWTPAVQDQGVVITQFVIYYEDSTGEQFEVPVPPTETQKELQVELGPAEFYMKAFDDAIPSEPSETVLFDVVPKVSPTAFDEYWDEFEPKQKRWWYK